ncbi:helix-turn-helix transcriptional regulator [Microbacterium imperiale]|uniref:Helix-turn-helix domain-containing protein n=1 Tax=Microbacterium imperiale TaxID=33884 RepID=A0A9W6HFS5_9MICO|nr:helix-turn-helix domain-containing protein [Microbacterium imperiale]MBP2422078.1 putative DNA-binding transcriptional regulator AlpA [Microbacterium imperiale]MDS0200237.1 helix-turn-helix domain-containing protein [Microbacterium imperiale]BFE39389.1 hypothetical protein GCM10017544_03450 [Microbacterium imperiale]GLJ79744.1 hypothetical protein GCM10017586_14260 [Microbacterium imperiale]
MSILDTATRPADTEPAELPPIATRAQVAAFTQVSVSTLAKWAMVHDGPKVTRVGKRNVRYRREDVLAWLEKAA